MYMQLMTGNMTINKQHVAAPPQSAYLSLSHTHTQKKYNTSRRFVDGIYNYLSSFYNNYTNTYYNTNIV